MMTKIKDFKEKQRLTVPLLIKDVKKGSTNKGAPYLTITAADDSGMIDGKFWDVKPADEEAIHIGHVENLTFDVIDYNRALQLRITHVEDLDQSALDLSGYVSSSSQSREVRGNKAERFVSSIQNQNLQKLVRGMMKKVGEKYYEYPAASKIHHNFLGGLSEHSLSMAEMADAICGQYPQLNRDLLIAGTLVHDMGKTAEMSGPVTTEYTLAGRLEGHISIANGWLTEVAEKEGLADSEEAILLHHMILAHHGKNEYGSPVLPQLQEAEVLYLIDNLDARLNTLKQALGGTEPGSWTAKLFALENRQFYKPKSVK